MTAQLASTVDQMISVGLGEVKISVDPQKYLACFGLGSCISLCCYDPVAKVAGMAHIVLPDSRSTGSDRTATKYADIATSVLLEDIVKEGASKSRLVVKLSGGAQMIQAPGFPNVLEMGKRNLESTRVNLEKEGLRILAEDVGGCQGRSVWLSVASGQVLVKTAGNEVRAL
jgi:chemotaxis protein CheD